MCGLTRHTKNTLLMKVHYYGHWMVTTRYACKSVGVVGQCLKAQSRHAGSLFLKERLYLRSSPRPQLHFPQPGKSAK